MLPPTNTQIGNSHHNHNKHNTNKENIQCQIVFGTQKWKVDHMTCTDNGPEQLNGLTL